MGSDPMDEFLSIIHPLALAAVFHNAYFTIFRGGFHNGDSQRML